MFQNRGGARTGGVNLPTAPKNGEHNCFLTLVVALLSDTCLSLLHKYVKKWV